MAKRKRYITGWSPDGEWIYDHVNQRGLVVIEPDREPARTGLLNCRGDEYFKIDDPNPIGFFAEVEDE